MKIPEGINIVTGTKYGNDDALKLIHSISMDWSRPRASSLNSSGILWKTK